MMMSSGSGAVYVEIRSINTCMLQGWLIRYWYYTTKWWKQPDARGNE